MLSLEKTKNLLLVKTLKFNYDWYNSRVHVDYVNISKKTMGHIYETYQSLSESPLDPQIRSLVELRTSQINGCAYCCTLHSEAARKFGINKQQLDELSAWQTSKVFDQKQKIALSWCESITYCKSSENELKSKVLEHFNEREMVDLTIAISLMNTLNRLAINLRPY